MFTICSSTRLVSSRLFSTLFFSLLTSCHRPDIHRPARESDGRLAHLPCCATLSRRVRATQRYCNYSIVVQYEYIGVEYSYEYATHFASSAIARPSLSFSQPFFLVACLSSLILALEFCLCLSLFLSRRDEARLSVAAVRSFAVRDTYSNLLPSESIYCTVRVS